MIMLLKFIDLKIYVMITYDDYQSKYSRTYFI